MEPAACKREGGGGPAPFLLKTYDMVDDSSSDEIVSWSSNWKSFVVWNPLEFSRLLLPTYFKHNNFSSFVRQLNTYGFRKIDHVRWEFANEYFIKDRRHLLRNIHRRKPVYTHSHPQGTLVNPERAAFDANLTSLSCEKKALEVDFLRFKQQHATARHQLEDLTQRVVGVEYRQGMLLTSVDSILQSETFVDYLIQKLESLDARAYNKKRRSVLENSENSSFQPSFGNDFHMEFSHKLDVVISPAGPDINPFSCSSRSSDAGSPWRKASDGEQDDAQGSGGGVLFAREALELSDTGASLSLKSEHKGLSSEGNGHGSCHLNLSLSYSPLQAGGGEPGQEIRRFMELEHEVETTRSTSVGIEDEARRLKLANVQVNDVFWEQFLT